MAARMDLPMLSVNACKMSNLDTSNVGSLANVWNVFHKCSHSLEDGPRLENRCWRILSRQTLPSDPTAQPSSPSRRRDLPRAQPAVPHPSQLAQKLQSVERSSSVAVEESPVPVSHTESSQSITSRPLPVLSLEKMVSGIQEKRQLEPLSPSITDAVPKPVELSPQTNDDDDAALHLSRKSLSNVSHRSSDSSTSTAPPSMYESERSMRPSVGSDTSAELLSCNSHSVVRGFSTNQPSSSYRSSVHLTPAETPVKSAPRMRPESVKKAGGFLLGGSSGEDESSFEDRMHSQPQQSSLTAGLRRPAPQKKQLSFRDVVESRRNGSKSHEDEEVFESDDDDDDVSDSAIDDSDDEMDEDDEEWEDDASEDPTDRPLFQRVDSKPNLVSRRSLLTTMMNEHDRAAAFQEEAMKNQAGLKRSKTSSNMQNAEETTTGAGNGLAVPQRPIQRTKSDLISLVSSPKTTRRNMLSTEINEDLRKSILHERLQKKSTINAYNKRVQSARNLPTLPLLQERGDAREEHDYYGQGIGAYHHVGW